MESTRLSVTRDDASDTSPRAISPTDISQFIRLEQCERYLRLRLREREEGRDFLDAYDVAAQSIPPILTRSGASFEQEVEAGIAGRYPTVRFSPQLRHEHGLNHDNSRALETLASLGAGETAVLFQPRIETDLDGWRIRGDVDILRVERDGEGRLHILIADMKSSTASRVEHRLQVAFYHRMLSTLMASAGIAHESIELAILYRGPVRESLLTPMEEIEVQEAQRRDAEETFGTPAGLLDRVTDIDAYLGSVDDLVTGRQSTARRVLATDFEDIPFHLTYKCDGCLYNEYCMKRSAESDDLSLLPHLTEGDKHSLQRAGITTTKEIASLKRIQFKGQVRVDGEIQEHTALVPAPGKESITRQLAATWPVGPRVDELIHRALRYQKWKTKTGDALNYIPNAGYGSLPYSDAGQNPNLVKIYVDAQHDYLHDRIYMLGALVVGNENGEEQPDRRRGVIRLTQGPPDSDERERQLFVDWITETLRAVVELAAPDADGKAKAPIHLIFVNSFAQRLLLDGLARHANTILGATALYDFVTQIAAFDSPIATYLEQQVSERRNYPMVCQSLQSVAAFLTFNWNEGTPYRDLFRTRMFDFWGKFDEPTDAESETPGVRGWYTSRARFNSQVPLEYAYAAWGELPVPEDENDEFESYRTATPELLQGFHARRLEAMEHITRDFTGNKQTAQTEFDLPDLAAFEQVAHTLAHALDEFVTIERHVELSAWKRERLASPEQRVLAGQTLIVQYREEDQEPGVAEQNRDNERRRVLNDAYRAAYREEHPDAKQIRLPKEQKAESEWTNEGMRFRLRITCAGVACDLDEALSLSTIKDGERLILCPRLTVDSRLPEADQNVFTPTAKQMLYGMRADLTRLTVERDPASGRAVRAFADVVMKASHVGGKAFRGFVFPSRQDRPLEAGRVYTLDSDPNSWYGYWGAKVTEGLIDEGENTLYALLSGAGCPELSWPEAAAAAQRRFLDGLDALHAAGAMHDFEPSKREFISQHGDAPLLLVQGPPGTGKSYSTAFALLARLQGAMAADRDFRVFLSCKTHAATDVLLENVVKAQKRLREVTSEHPDIAEAYFDPRLVEVPLYRVRPRGGVPDGVIAIPKDAERETDQPKAVERLQSSRWWVAASTPGGIYGIVKERWPKALFGNHLADCLVLDEASQMNLPEAAMAALPLAPSGQLIVVGDHRQMPPIVKNDWGSEPRRSFKEFRTYESLFLTLLALEPPMIQFEESFRLHADMAEFLRREIYHLDGIDYHSNRHDVLASHPIDDTFVAAVLAPEHPLTVVVHDEARSQVHNAFEQQLLTPVLEALADPALFGLDPEAGLGVVVPHRAQRAALREGVPQLVELDPETGTVAISAVDTVERFQGGERTAILIGATESDREYILANGTFLLDPRRLTVALSRAKQKMVLVASRSVFEVFSADEETFANAQLWKNLLRRTCTVPLWDGERCGHHVTVWGNRSTATPQQS